MLSPGQFNFATRLSDAGANSLADSGHSESGNQLLTARVNPLAARHIVHGHHRSLVGGNTLLGASTRATPICKSPRALAPGHTANANRNPRAGAILRRAVRPSTTNNPSLAVLTPSQVAHASGHNQPAGDSLLVATEPADHQRGRATDSPRPIAHENHIQLAEGNLTNETREASCG